MTSASHPHILRCSWGVIGKLQARADPQWNPFYTTFSSTTYHAIRHQNFIQDNSPTTLRQSNHHKQTRNMSFRPATSILAQTRGAFALKTTPRVVKSVRFSTALPRYKESVASGYGDDGSPTSAHPKEQGAESQAHRNLEHPGPAPVSEGRPKTSARDSPSFSSSHSGEPNENKRSNSVSTV
jgi:hypothetical protein